MNSASTNASPSPVVWAVYDLALPGREERLQQDRTELQALGAVVFVAARRGGPNDVFLDGTDIESEWLKQDRWRATLETLRTELASHVDGEVFLRAARRAVWLAAQAKSTVIPALLYGAGVAESVTAWLAGQLLAVPFAASLEDPSRWNNKLIAQLKTEAKAVRDSTLSSCVTAALSSLPA